MRHESVGSLAVLWADSAAAVIAIRAALALFVRRSLRSDRPVIDVRLFRHPVLRAGVVAALASSMLMASVLFVGSQWLQLVEGMGPLRSGLALVAVLPATYELGAVLGITFLGSLVGAVYRAGLPDGVGAAARESLAGAVGAVGAALAAYVVWRLVPADLTLDDSQH